MDAEPRGQTLDGTPWEEPRPPHLPDRLTAISPWVLPFLVVVAFQVWLLWVDQPQATDFGSQIQYWLGTRYGLTGLLGSLVGLALFIRHPDARITVPQLASGAFLLLLAQVLGLLESTLDPFFVTLSPPSEDLAFFSPLKQAFSFFTSLVGIFGIVFIASGLSAARRYEDAARVPKLRAVLAIVAVVSAGFAIVGLTTVDFEVSPALVGTVIGSLMVNFFGTLAAAYLVVVSLTGWIGQEEPRSGWGLAGLGAGLILLTALLTPVLGALLVSQDVLLAVIGVMADGALVGWVLLVVAFVLGLPSTASIPDQSVEPASPGRSAVTRPGSAGG